MMIKICVLSKLVFVAVIGHGPFSVVDPTARQWLALSLAKDVVHFFLLISCGAEHFRKDDDRDERDQHQNGVDYDGPCSSFLLFLCYLRGPIHHFNSRLCCIYRILNINKSLRRDRKRIHHLCQTNLVLIAEVQILMEHSKRDEWMEVDLLSSAGH